MNELLDLTIEEASDLLARRSVSAVELTEATLGRIADTEATVHAYATVLAEEARTAAEKADHEIAQSGQRSRLHGIPLAVKDNMYTENIPTEGGSRVLAGFMPSYDATAVRRLRDAGAILVGKTVCHEFAFGVNEPPTRTPWDLACYPGGSSAGSGVAVSVRSAWGALGSDTGGSIRIPAAINGIVGMKPTYGRVSGYGVLPLAWSLDHVGPLTRTVTDCAIVLQAIAGYDPQDSGSVDRPVPHYRAEIETGVRGLKIGVERPYYFYEGVTDDVRAAVKDVIASYERQGAVIVEVSIPELTFTVEALLTIMLAEASTYHRRFLRSRGGDYDPATRAMLELGELVPATHYLTAQRARSLFRDAIRRLFQEHRLDAMLWPTIPLPTVPLESLFALRQDGIAETPMGSYIHHTFSANLTGQPAISVPCGLSRAGLPIGFQLTGRPFAEATLLRLARAYERNHTWYTTLRPVVAH